MHNKIIIAILLIGATTSASQSAMSDSVFLDLVQRASFDFFWQEANPGNGLIKDRSASGAPYSIASVGLGLSSICVAIERGWITRAAGRDRVLTTLKTFWQKPQGRDAQGHIGYKGFFYHFLDMTTVTRTWISELSSIDTALLLAGILDAKHAQSRHRLFLKFAAGDIGGARLLHCESQRLERLRRKRVGDHGVRWAEPE